MTDKTRIIDALGEPKLLLPALVNEALAANDRAKFYFALLQMAQAHADDPQRRTPELLAERTGASVDEDALDSLPIHSARLGPGRYCVLDVMITSQRALQELLSKQKLYEGLLHSQHGVRQPIVQSLVHRKHVAEVASRLAGMPSQAIDSLFCSPTATRICRYSACTGNAPAARSATPPAVWTSSSTLTALTSSTRLICWRVSTNGLGKSAVRYSARR